MENTNSEKVGNLSLWSSVNLELTAFDLLELEYVLTYARERMLQDSFSHGYDLSKIASFYERLEQLAKQFK